MTHVDSGTTDQQRSSSSRTPPGEEQGDVRSAAPHSPRSRVLAFLRERGVQVDRWILAGMLLSLFLGMTGGTWDAGWHVTFLRETFWSPPHILLYAATAGSMFLGLAAVLVARLQRRPIPLGFAIVALGAFIVIEAAPLDEFWHRTFGRDVDVWSFPHLVALAGGMAISIGCVLALEADRRRFPGSGFLHKLVMVLFISVLLWATMFSLNWYTLVLATLRESVKYPILAALVASPALVFATARVGRWGATASAAIYMLYVALAHGVMALFGMAHLPFPPVLLLPAIVIDVVYWRLPTNGWRRAAMTGAFFAPFFFLAEALSLKLYPHPPMQDFPTDALALSYYLEAVARPWDLAHVAVSLPIAMVVGALSAQLGAWLGEIQGLFFDADRLFKRARRPSVGHPAAVGRGRG